jgi:3-methyladenine DNA glycosylase/8-oxoguanine DNA glycosylase
MVMATELPESKLGRSVFTLEEIKQYMRRAKIHMDDNNARRVVALAIEFGKEMDARKEKLKGEVHPLEELIEHKQIIDALHKRGMYTAEDVVARGVWAIIDTRISRNRIKGIWELCKKIASIITKE